MSASTYAGGHGVPMSWEDDDRRTGDRRGEYVDGVFWPVDAPRRAGLPRFWLLDPRDRFLEALVLADGSWELAGRATDDETVTLDTGAGVLTTSPAALLD